MASNASAYNANIKDYSQSLNDQLKASFGSSDANMAGINASLPNYVNKTNQLNNPDPGSVQGDAQSGAQGIMNQYNQTLSGLMANPGYTGAEKSGMREAAIAPISSAYGTAQYQNTADAARTGNAGAASANNAALARSKGRDMSTSLAGLQGQFANARMTGQQNAMGDAGLSGQYAQNVLQGQQQNAQLMQFPSTLQAGLYNTNMGNQASLNSAAGGVTADYLARAQKPGFLANTASQVVGGLTGQGSKLASIA